jgi:ABC-type molybdate transport system substrate-binding protein
MAALSASKNADLANAFVNFVLSPEGQAVMERYGFSSPK